MKFLFTSDWHICSQIPSKRIDVDFFLNQLAKVDEVMNLAVTQKVDAVIHGGDVFDSPMPEYGTLNAIAFRLRKLRRAKIPCYITFGSHDMFGYNLPSIEKTAVGNLIHSGLMKQLIGFMYINDIPFYGMPALANHTRTAYNEVPEHSIVITHNLLLPEAVPYEHLLFDELANMNHLFLCGHYHKTFSSKKNGSVFMNTGPLVRTDKTEVDHTPNVLIVNTEPKITIRRYVIPHSKNVFDLSEKPELTPTFIESLQTTHFNFFDLFDLTKQMALQAAVNEDILKEALNRLEEAQKGLL